MDSPLAEDHATLGWSADGRVPLQPWDHFDILHLSQHSVHSGAKQGIFVLPFLLAVLLWSRQTRPKNKSRPFHWFMTASRLQPAVCQHSSNQSVCPLFHQHCVCSFCVGVLNSALPLYESTVAPGQSLGIGKREGCHGV